MRMDEPLPLIPSPMIGPFRILAGVVLLGIGLRLADWRRYSGRSYAFLSLFFVVLGFGLLVFPGWWH